MSVTGQWRSLLGVLHEFAPVTAASFQPGASAQSIDRAEAATGCTWPAELKEWFTVQNGQVDPADDCAGELLAHQTFFSLETMLEERRSLQDTNQVIIDCGPDFFESGSAGVVEQNPFAGVTTELFLPSYVPISGEDGLDNYCDTRSGLQSGCIGFWTIGGTPGSPPLWGSISDMLAAIESYISDGPPEGWKLVVEDGAMHWEVEVDDVPVVAAPPRSVFAPGFETDPNYTVTPSWPEIPTDSLSDKSVAAIRSHHVPRDQSVDLIAVQQAVMDDAAGKIHGTNHRNRDARTVRRLFSGTCPRTATDRPRSDRRAHEEVYRHRDRHCRRFRY